MFTTFQSMQGIIKQGLRITKGELAESVYGGENYDCAIPQSWLDDAHARGMDMIIGDTYLDQHFVTLYPEKGIPYVAPITAEGVKVVSILASAK